MPLSGTDWRTGTSYQYLGYVPDPLPVEISLRGATRAAVAQADRGLRRLDHVARRLAGPPTPLDRGATSAQAYAWARGRPLTAELVHGLQAAVVRGTRGDSGDAGRLRRGNVYLGDRERPIAYSRFVPTPHGPLGAAFDDWVQWLNRAQPHVAPVVEAGLAHYQFVTLHPYSDGNGRVGRLAIMLTLIRRQVLRYPVLDLEAWLAGHRAEYQDGLLDLSRSGDWDSWVGLFASGIASAAQTTERRLQAVLDDALPTCRSLPATRRRGRRPAGIAASVLAAASLAACGSSGTKSVTGITGKSEVVASPVSSTGANPFTPAVGKDKGGLKPPAAAASSTGGASAYVASLPGLYGGTRNYQTCDADKLVAFLEQNPSKAAAWASTLGISTGQISQYVSTLTPVLLRTDTRVTNHGYINGVADPIQSVLEAGTAVFVNRYGEPVVKCYCGNPLTAPQLLSAPVYTGPLWASFTTINITIIEPSPTVINTYTLYDPNTGTEFPRTSGRHGHDGPYIGAGPKHPATTTGGTTPPTQPPQPSTNSTPTPPPTTSQPVESPSISLSPNPVVAGSTVTLTGNGFLPGKSLQITVNRPDGGTDQFSAASDAQGHMTFTFPNAGGSITGTYQVTVTDADTNASATSSIDVLPPSSGSGANTTT